MHRCLRLGVGIAIVATLAACGSIHQRNEHYRPTERQSPDPRVLMGFHNTRTETDEGGPFGDREIYDGAPYTAFLSVHAPEQLEAQLVVRAVTLVVGETRHVLHDEQPPLTAAFALGSGTDPWYAMVKLPLGDQLPFVEGQIVSLDFDATWPGSDAGNHVVRSYRGEASDVNGIKLDEIVGQ